MNKFRWNGYCQLKVTISNKHLTNKYFNQRWTFNPFFTDILIKNGLDIQVFISKTS